MTTTQSNFRAVGDERGLTIVELLVSTVLTFVLAGLGYGAVVFLHSSTSFNEAKLHQEATYRDTLHWLREELRMASLDPDPATGLLRYRIEDVPGAGKALVYKKIEGARIVGHDLQTVWSPEIRISSDAQGVLRRFVGDQATIVTRGIKHLDFLVASGAFVVSVTTVIRDPRTGMSTDVVESVRIRPSN